MVRRSPGKLSPVRMIESSSLLIEVRGSFAAPNAMLGRGDIASPSSLDGLGKVPPAKVSEETICHVDFLATVAAILDEKLPDSTAEDSINLLPVLLGEKTSAPLREATVHHSARGKFAIGKGTGFLSMLKVGTTMESTVNPNGSKINAVTFRILTKVNSSI